MSYDDCDSSDGNSDKSGSDKYCEEGGEDAALEMAVGCGADDVWMECSMSALLRIAQH